MFPAARLPSTCAACHAAAALLVEQAIEGGRLVWRERFACDCGHGFEASGVGLPTPGARAALLAQSGQATLWVDGPLARELTTRVLVKLLGVSQAEADARLATLPARAYEGTRAEVAFIAAALEPRGVGVRIEAPPLGGETPS